ncbi:hypothetical protein SDC9_99732 [bioreactor metagenome]|uniref:Uncharacterized protein n=1 Tax=bioreactor metagenome TaxID=1076179 RepID=A0A645AJQ1_9ZZZZ
MDVCLADDGNTFLIQKAVGRAWHDAYLPLKRVPALDGAGLTAVLADQAFHCHLQCRNVFKLLVVQLGSHIRTYVGDCLRDLRLLGNGRLHLVGDLRQGNWRKLNVEFFQELALVAHRRGKVIGTRANL